MRIAALIARYLLGLIFTVFGLNGFLHFIKQPPPVNPLAIQFFTSISLSHFSAMFFAVQLVAGLLLLGGVFVPLALILLAAEILNILTFHLTMDPAASVSDYLLPFSGWCASFTTARALRHSFKPSPPQFSCGCAARTHTDLVYRAAW